MEKKLDLIIQMITYQDKKIDSLDLKIDSVKEEMNDQYSSLKEEMNGKYDSVTQEMNGLKGKVSIIEQKLDNLSNQVTVLESYAHEKCETALDAWKNHLEKQEQIEKSCIILNGKTENHEIRISALESNLDD